jgi:anti-sigma factor ChrR (cupin superfamily)
MSPASAKQCIRAEQVAEYALGAMPETEKRAMDAHLATCRECRDDLETLRGVVDSLAYWPADVVRPSPLLWDQVAQRIGLPASASLQPGAHAYTEPDWEQAAPGISVKILASDQEGDRVSMLVRLEPDTYYPPHRHAGTEELHLLEGELWIEDRKLVPGDYNYREAGTADQRVWSETGCTCLLITSPSDSLR